MQCPLPAAPDPSGDLPAGSRPAVEIARRRSCRASAVRRFARSQALRDEPEEIANHLSSRTRSRTGSAPAVTRGAGGRSRSPGPQAWRRHRRELSSSVREATHRRPAARGRCRLWWRPRQRVPQPAVPGINTSRTPHRGRGRIAAARDESYDTIMQGHISTLDTLRLTVRAWPRPAAGMPQPTVHIHGAPPNSCRLEWT
jgi:hypothetical protein